MAGPPTTVWVEVATELLAELGDWSEPVQVRITDLRPNGQVEMVLRSTEGPDADLAVLRRWKAEALEVLAAWELVWEAAGRPGPLGGSKAQAVRDLLVRHGIREA
ncbi:MAG: hypothetical protein R2761_16170 [Acidimicrobiales bacterium]